MTMRWVTVEFQFDKVDTWDQSVPNCNWPHTPRQDFRSFGLLIVSCKDVTREDKQGWLAARPQEQIVI